MLNLRDYDFVQEQRKDQTRQIARQRLIRAGRARSEPTRGRYQAMRGWVGRHLVSWGQQIQAGTEQLEHSR